MENPFELLIEKIDRLEKAVERLSASSNINDASSNRNDEFMNIEQVANFVGLSKDTIYGLTHKKLIPHFKTGKKLYFNKAEIADWISSKRVKTNQEINQILDSACLEIH